MPRHSARGLIRSLVQGKRTEAKVPATASHTTLLKPNPRPPVAVYACLVRGPRERRPLLSHRHGSSSTAL